VSITLNLTPDFALKRTFLHIDYQTFKPAQSDQISKQQLKIAYNEKMAINILV